MNKLQVIVISICCSVTMLDGMDMLILTYAAPQVIEQWSVSPQAFGIIFSAGLVGSTIGAVFVGPFADIVGRRVMILLSVVLLAVSVGLCAAAQTVPQLVVLRTVTGIAMGFGQASLAPMVAEYAPEGKKGLAVSIYGAGYSVGAVLTGFVAAWIIPTYGWQMMFIFAAVVTALMFPIAYFFLPESLEFLCKTQPRGALEKANKVLTLLNEPKLEVLPNNEAQQKTRVGIRGLVTKENWTSTLALWGAFFMTLVTVYFLLSWFPKIVTDAGLPLEKGIHVTMFLSLGGIVGMVSMGVLSTHFTLKSLIVVFQLLSAGVMVIYGVNSPPVAILFVLAALLGFLGQGSLVGLLAAATQLYETEVRATGVGWAMGAMRLGAVCGPFLGGTLISLGWQQDQTFLFFAAPCVIAAFAAMGIRLKLELPKAVSKF